MGDELDSSTTDYPRNYYKAKRQRERKRLGEEEIIGPLGSGVVGGGVDASSKEQLQVQSHQGVADGAPRAAAAVGNHKHQRRGGKVQLSAKDVELFGGFSIVNMHTTNYQE